MVLKRGAEPILNRLLDSSKVVVLEGGRGVGKTTLARKAAAERGFGTVFDLSDPADRSALRQDPHRVLAAATKPVLIDEAQLEQELPVAVKRFVDESPDRGQVLLTGSARIGRGALGGGDPLAGRAVRLRLHSFTQGELTGTPVNSVESWWSEDPHSPVHQEVGLTDMHRRFVVGGLPSIAIDVDEDPVDLADHQQRILTNYVDGVLTMALAGGRTNQARLLKTYRYLAANPGQVLNKNRAASELAIRAETVQSDIDLCVSSFLLDVAPAMRPTEHQSLTAHPRVFPSDVGLAAWAAGTSVDRLLTDTSLSGSLLENLVAHELQAQSSWSSSPASLMHWRDTRAGKEVDMLLRRPNGDILAFEVKSASSVSMADARGLVAFAQVAGTHLKRSFIIYTGRAVQQLDESVWAVPLTTLLEAPGQHGPSGTGQ